jgi:chromosome segregation ATPase
MDPSGRRTTSARGERRAIGLFSLILGGVLFVLILARGQQAAREGNQELRNDTYWVLVSPLVFSGFGLWLLRSGGGRPGAVDGRPLPSTRLQRTISSARREAERSEQTLAAIGADAEQRLAAAQRELTEAQAAAAESEQRLQQAAADSQARITALEQQLAAMRQTRDRAEADLQSLLEGRSRSDDRSPQPNPAQIQALQQRLEQLSRGLEQRLAEAREAQALALARQQSDLERLEQALAQSEKAASTGTDQAAAATAALEGRLSGMGSQLQELERERSQLSGSLEQLRREQTAAAQASRAAGEAARRDLDTALNRFNSERSALQSQLDRFLEQEGQQLGQARRQLDAALAQLDAARAEQLAASQATSSRLVAMEQQIQEAQQAGLEGSGRVATALAGLERARAQLHNGLEATRERLELAAGRLGEQLGQARSDAARALQLSQEARELLDQFALGAAAQEAGTSNGSAGGSGGFQAGYREACEEIGVLPGSDWAVVRATWRRNLKAWHPDQGGDPQRWMRRNAAYQLLTAWYEFHAAG